MSSSRSILVKAGLGFTYTTPTPILLKVNWGWELKMTCLKITPLVSSVSPEDHTSVLGNTNSLSPSRTQTLCQQLKTHVVRIPREMSGLPLQVSEAASPFRVWDERLMTSLPSPLEFSPVFSSKNKWILPTPAVRSEARCVWGPSGHTGAWAGSQGLSAVGVFHLPAMGHLPKPLGRATANIRQCVDRQCEWNS